MPYRRLPNTDVARIRALKAAHKKGKSLPPFDLAFSQATFARIELFINSFEKAMLHYKGAYNTQVERSRDFSQVMKKAKLYISHFIQVLNMAIARGELHPEVRVAYGLDPSDPRLPSLNTEKDILEWGKKIIEGEMQRMRSGNAPITNPTIAVVRVRYEQFVEVYNNHKILQQNTQRMLNDLNNLRKTADEIILNIWNEVEDHFSNLSDEEKRESSAEYGVVYVFRKNELKSINLVDKVLPNLF
ncbi:MAG: hypothetical protein H6537_03200 [Bacteroidales bacterium]|nr:hypothetical protein [Bacteroidales bacterium]HPD94477.1 hypothetical protein [Tenuifilaceae bacterium]HRX31768.1 hypothetical protein [Tenuifilaceae bacterium]